MSEQSQPLPALGKFSSALPIRSDTALICTVGEKSPSAKKAALRHLRVTGFSLMRNDNLVKRAKGSKHHPARTPGQHQWGGSTPTHSPRSPLSAWSLPYPFPQIPVFARPRHFAVWAPVWVQGSARPQAEPSLCSRAWPNSRGDVSPPSRATFNTS